MLSRVKERELKLTPLRTDTFDLVLYFEEIDKLLCLTAKLPGGEELGPCSFIASAHCRSPDNLMRTIVYYCPQHLDYISLPFTISHVRQRR